MVFSQRAEMAKSDLGKISLTFTGSQLQRGVRKAASKKVIKRRGKG